MDGPSRYSEVYGFDDVRIYYPFSSTSPQNSEVYNGLSHRMKQVLKHLQSRPSLFHPVSNIQALFQQLLFNMKTSHIVVLLLAGLATAAPLDLEKRQATVGTTANEYTRSGCKDIIFFLPEGQRKSETWYVFLNTKCIRIYN